MSSSSSTASELQVDAQGKQRIFSQADLDGLLSESAQDAMGVR